MKFAVFAALIGVSLPAPALAADWVLLDKGVDGDKLYIDRQSIRAMPNGYKRAWLQFILSEANEDGNTKFKTYTEYNCIEKQSRNLSIIFYKGEDVTFNGSRVGNWTYVAPESLEESLLQFVCRR
jgi:hypothetical protein